MRHIDPTLSAPVYVAPKDLARRWCCSRSSVDRIARRVGLTKVFLGDGPNGLVRYIWKEVVSFELKRHMPPTSGP